MCFSVTRRLMPLYPLSIKLSLALRIEARETASLHLIVSQSSIISMFCICLLNTKTKVENGYLPFYWRSMCWAVGVFANIEQTT